MENIATIANSQLKTKGFKTIGYRSIEHLKADSRIQEVIDMGLISDLKYKPYFYKRYYALGDTLFMELARRALLGKHPARLFCALLGK